jgi:hypothetical protein
MVTEVTKPCQEHDAQKPQSFALGDFRGRNRLHEVLPGRPRRWLPCHHAFACTPPRLHVDHRRVLAGPAADQPRDDHPGRGATPRRSRNAPQLPPGRGRADRWLRREVVRRHRCLQMAGGRRLGAGSRAVRRSRRPAIDYECAGRRGAGPGRVPQHLHAARCCRRPWHRYELLANAPCSTWHAGSPITCARRSAPDGSKESTGIR